MNRNKIDTDYRPDKLLNIGEKTRIFRGFNYSDNKPVIIKQLINEYPQQEALARFFLEYQTTRSLDITGVIKALDYGIIDNRYSIVFEDVDGISLKELISFRKLNLKEKVEILIKICDIIQNVHIKNIIHKDINLSNIIITKDLKSVKLIDFGISAFLSRETPFIVSPKHLEGTLTYISPEQTGRMNRTIDYRSDYYSFGITSYELITGKPPFYSSDPMELIHSHIAKIPAEPHSTDKTIPKHLSDIIMKMISKRPEDRYKSIMGFKHDLEVCLKGIEGADISNFNPFSKDVPLHFTVSQDIYGREQSIEAIYKAYRNSLENHLEIVMITGYSGIGKSSVVNEMQKSFIKDKAIFISGKYDQYNRSYPYSAILSALNKAIKEILCGDESDISNWKERFITALGNNGKVITDVIPDFELIVGKQEDLPDLPTQQAQNRFVYSFKKFISVFCTEDHPLVIFIDDLQWADYSSIKLIEALINDYETKNMVLIGAYRDNEVEQTHPLIIALKNYTDNGNKLVSINLLPLEIDAVKSILSDSLYTDKDSVAELSEVIINKTGGNPFFINQFLVSLYEEGLIYYNTIKNNWDWDINKIQTKGVSANIIDHIVDKLSKLDPDTLKILQAASCIGNEFDNEILGLITGLDRNIVINSLYNAIDNVLIVPQSDEYRYLDSANSINCSFIFTHDRIMQAVYLMIDKNSLSKLHYNIGKTLFNNVNLTNESHRIFDIANNFSLSIDLVKNDPDKKSIAELFLNAGKRAKDCTGYDQSLNLFKCGIELVESEGFDKTANIRLIINIFTEGSEAAYMAGYGKLMEKYSDKVLQITTNIDDIVRINDIIIQRFTSENNLQKALDKGVETLLLLGVNIERHPSFAGVLKRILKVETLLIGRSYDKIFESREMSDERFLNAIRILTTLTSAAYFSDPILFLVIVVTMTHLSLKYGINACSGYAFGTYGIILNSLGMIDRAFSFGELALRLLNKFKGNQLKAKTLLIVNAFEKHYKQSIRSELTNAWEAYKIAQEIGDLEYFAIGCFVITYSSFFSGEKIQSLLSNLDGFCSKVEKVNQLTVLNFLNIYRQLFFNISNKTDNPLLLNGPYYIESVSVKKHEDASDQSALYLYHFCKMILCYMFGSYEDGIKHSIEAKKYIRSVLASVNEVYYYFYDSLLRLKKWELTGITDNNDLKIIKKNLKKFEKWGYKAPMNYYNKYLIIKAYLYSLSDKKYEAIALFQDAIRYSKANGLINDESLVNELYAEYWKGAGNIDIHNQYMVKAYQSYNLWGATKKAEIVWNSNNLNSFYSNPLKKATYQGSTSHSKSSSSETGSGFFDMMSVYKSSSVISAELRLSDLIAKMLKIVNESAGAQKSVLILHKQNEYIIDGVYDSVNDVFDVLSGYKLDHKINGQTLIPLSIINYVMRTKDTVIINDVEVDIRFGNDNYLKEKAPKSILCFPLINKGRLSGVLYFENDLLSYVFSEERLNVINLLSSQIVVSIENAILYRDLELSNNNLKDLITSFERFIPREFLKQLGRRSILEIDLGDQVEMNMGVMFADIRDFTALSENLTPKENFDFINSYLKRICPTIRDYRGFIDKYIGDAVMALFPNSVEDAIDAAITMQHQVDLYNSHRTRTGYIPIKIGIGIHFGRIMLGIIGESERIETTVISDAVNLASRLESLTKEHKAKILISGDTFNLISNKNKYQYREIGSTAIKGKTKPVSIIEIIC